MKQVAIGVLAVLALVVGGWFAYREYVGGDLPRWQGVVSPGPLSKAHAFLEKDCESCHVPVQGVASLSCTACHADVMTALAQQNTAFHAQVKDCQGCHIEHRGLERRPTAMDHDALIAAAAKRLDTPPPPASDGWAKRALRDFLGDETPTAPATPEQRAALACDDCHANQDPHRGVLGKDCAQCHGTKEWTIASFQHPSPRSQDCAQCHAAPPSHLMMGHFQMLKTMTKQEHVDVSQCQACHRTNAWNEIKGLGWFEMH